MNRTTLQMNPMTRIPTLYLSMELSEKSWGLLFSDGQQHSAHSAKVGDVAAVLAHAKSSAKRFGLPPGVLIEANTVVKVTINLME